MPNTFDPENLSTTLKEMTQLPNIFDPKFLGGLFSTHKPTPKKDIIDKLTEVISGIESTKVIWANLLTLDFDKSKGDDLYKLLSHAHALKKSIIFLNTSDINSINISLEKLKEYNIKALLAIDTKSPLSHFMEKFLICRRRENFTLNLITIPRLFRLCLSKWELTLLVYL